MAGINSLVTIIKRLEAATLRLEDIAVAQGAPVAVLDGSDDEFTSGPRGAPRVPPAPASAPPPEDPMILTAYDENIIQGKLKPFLEITEALGVPIVSQIVQKFEKLLKSQRLYLHRAATCRRPDQKTVDELWTALAPDIADVYKFKDDNFKELTYQYHLVAVAEGSGAIGWISSPEKPGPWIASVKDTVSYSGNKVISQFKEKNPKHVEWVRALLAVLEESRKYVMEHHTTGVTWNHNGIPIENYSTATAPAGQPGPPPPPPPPPAAVAAHALPPSSSGSPAALFAEINNADVTKGLRKVDKSEMTHKNPSLRGSSVVPATTPSPGPKKPTRPTKPQSLMGKKPAKLALEGSKWVVEYQENERSLVIDELQINQSINIYGCKNSTIILKSKVNAVTIVNSPKTQVLIDSVVSAISVTNSPSFVIQVTGKAPMIQIDSTDSGQVYISKDSIDVEITTAKCSSINISIPVAGEDDGIFDEQPVPEMLKTTIQKGKLVTTTVDHMG